jgi:hypothetical protein
MLTMVWYYANHLLVKNKISYPPPSVTVSSFTFMPPQAQTPSSVMPIYTSPQQTNSTVAQYASVSTGPSIEQSPSSQIPLFSTQQYQSNSSMAFDSSKTTVVKKRVPVTYQATVQWEKHVYPAQDVKETVQQPIYLIQEIPNFPLRKTTVEPEKKPEPIRERARPERSAPPPKPETIYKDKYNIVEVTREVVKVVEKRVDVPIEKVKRSVCKMRYASGFCSISCRLP